MGSILVDLREHYGLGRSWHDWKTRENYVIDRTKDCRWRKNNARLWIWYNVAGYATENGSDYENIILFVFDERFCFDFPDR